jgi:hypothetical protein
MIMHNKTGWKTYLELYHEIATDINHLLLFNTGNAFFFVKEQYHNNIVLQVLLEHKLIFSEGELTLSLR